jgi:hypothetical protein
MSAGHEFPASRVQSLTDQTSIFMYFGVEEVYSNSGVESIAIGVQRSKWLEMGFGIGPQPDSRGTSSDHTAAVHAIRHRRHGSACASLGLTYFTLSSVSVSNWSVGARLLLSSCPNSAWARSIRSSASRRPGVAQLGLNHCVRRDMIRMHSVILAVYAYAPTLAASATSWCAPVMSSGGSPG